MLVQTINSFNTYKNYINNKPNLQNPSIKTLRYDSFQRSNIINFGSKGFDKIFPRAFFKKLEQEGIPCAYTGVELISKNDYKLLTSLDSLRHPIPITITYLNSYEKSLYEFPKKILSMLNLQVQDSKQKSICDILKNKKHESEKKMRIKQLALLNKILITAQELPKNDYRTLKTTIIHYIDKLTEQEVHNIELKPEVISREFAKINCKDEKLKKKIKNLIEKIPTDKNSTDAYIVTNGKGKKSIHKSNMIATDLLKMSVCSYEHFWPQELYKDKQQKNKFIILTTTYVNHLKANTTPDDFIKKYKRYKIKNNMQAQVNRLIEIYNKWRYTDPKNANRLLKYILAYKYEIENRSKLVKIDIDDFLTSIKSSKNEANKLKQADNQIRQMLELEPSST